MRARVASTSPHSRPRLDRAAIEEGGERHQGSVARLPPTERALAGVRAFPNKEPCLSSVIHVLMQQSCNSVVTDFLKDQDSMMATNLNHYSDERLLEQAERISAITLDQANAAPEIWTVLVHRSSENVERLKVDRMLVKAVDNLKDAHVKILEQWNDVRGV